VLADCRHDQIVRLASLYGLQTVTIPRKPEPGKSVRADLLSPEPLEIWSRAGRRPPSRHGDVGRRQASRTGRPRVTERLARAPFHLVVSSDGAGIALAYRPALLVDAIWQRFACEAAGIIHCAKCPAPNCRRWFLRSQTRSDRQYCSHACRMRAWRR